MEKMKIWNKFHPLFGSDLKVAFETTFAKNTDLSSLNPFYSKNGLIHEKPEEAVIRVYEPTTNVIGSEKEGLMQIFFEPLQSIKALFQRLVFFKKPHKWMIATRYNESGHFGFNAHNSRNNTYLSLAYPGLAKTFSPVFIKIQNSGNFVYLGVWAWNEDKKTVVWARKIDERSFDWIPKPLIRTHP